MNMKKLNEGLWVSFLLFVAINMIACSSEKEEILPEFPTVQTINAVANSEETFSFNANMDWRLSSNKTWCTLASAEMEGQNISGKAGSQTVTIKISDVGLTFDDAKATLTLSMGTESQVAAEVIRAGKQYELKVYDLEGNVINSVAIGIEATIDFSVEANFEFAATAYSKWLEVISETDKNNPGKKNITLIVKDEYLKNPLADGNITFSNSDGSISFPVVVTYAGMDPTRIEMVSNDVETYSTWNWVVSMDGQTFTKKNDMTSTIDEVNGAMKFHITALNDAYTPVFMEEYNGEYYFDAAEWIHLEQVGETATLTVDASDRARNGIVMVFPNAVYNEIKNDLVGHIIDAEGLINYEYENNYMLISFAQKNADSGAFLVRNGRTWDEIENQKVEDKDLLEFIQGNSAGQVIENVYSIQVEPGTSLIIYPQLSADAWTCEMGAMVMGDNDPNLEPAMDESGNHYLGYVVPKAAQDNIYIFIKDSNWQFLKVLVIVPQK